MKKSVKLLAISSIFCPIAFGSVCGANDCPEIDTESTIAKLVADNEGSKVLKVEETADAQGCVVLKVRILIDGTVKAITIPSQTGA